MLKERDLQRLSSYEIVKKEELPDLRTTGFILKHRKTGARMMLIPAKDENKVFNVAFRTPPKNSTGVAHILEHSVLCGSKKFPLRDPFVELVKSSFNTFINALTGPDKTMYPFASTNEKDFRNLMHVYLDAVFYPNIYQEEKIFLQEGWRYELKKESDPLTINGVVYNEMKGDFSSPETLLLFVSTQSLFPESPYGFDSGGDPDHIPDLSYEEFLDFHARYYHPSNSYFFLYGNLDMVDALSFIDRQYLSHFRAREIDSGIRPQKPFTKLRRLEKSYPLTQGEDPKGKTYFSYNVKAGDPFDTEEMAALSVLDYALFSAPGAPVKQALLDAGIAKDISSKFSDDIYEPYFSIIAKEAKAKDEKRFLRVMEEALKKQLKSGIDKRALLAGINLQAFHYREADFGNYPKGLIYSMSVYNTWLYDEAMTFVSVQRDAAYRKLRRRIGTRYFENLLRRVFIEEAHRSLVVLRPEVGLLIKKEQALKKILAKKKKAMSQKELRALIKAGKELEKWQTEPENPKDLATIPTLSRKDIKAKVTRFSNRKHEIGGVPLILHRAPANGIGYPEALFEIGDLTKEELFTASLLIKMLGKVSTSKHSYDELAHEIGIISGGFSFGIRTYADAKKKDHYRAFISCQTRCLKENLQASLRLLAEILTDSRFDDLKRMQELLQAAVLDGATEIQMAGSRYALVRAMSFIKPEAAFLEYTSGIECFLKFKEWAGLSAKGKKRLSMELAAMAERIFVRKRLLLHASCEAADEQILLKGLNGFLRKIKTGKAIDAFRPCEVLTKAREAIVTSGQVQYVAQCGNGGPEAGEKMGYLHILRHLLSYDYLWKEVRVQGGAYGCAANFTRSGDAWFYSYRDPRLTETLDVYQGIPEYVKAFKASEKEMTKLIIGTLSQIDIPLTPYAYGSASMTSYLTGNTQKRRQAVRDQLIHAKDQDLRELAGFLQSALKDACVCAVVSEGAYQARRNAFDREIEIR